LPPISDKKFIKKRGEKEHEGGLGQNPQKSKQEQKKKTEDRKEKEQKRKTRNI